MTTRAHFEHRGFTLSYLDSSPGDASLEVVLLLHGFPDEAMMWRPQIGALCEAGYRVIAPDTLGCGHSDMAPRVRDYNAKLIASDHVALLDHLSVKQAHVVGHDWGSVIAWFVAGHWPQRSLSLTAMSVGHPTAYGRASWSQKAKAWYTYFFQLGTLADALLVGKSRFGLRQIFGSHPDMDEVMSRLSAKGRLTAAVRIYRANVAEILFKKQPMPSVPTLGIYSEKDAFTTEAQMKASEKWVTGPWRFERFTGHHWTPREHRQAINTLLLDHFQTSR